MDQAFNRIWQPNKEAKFHHTETTAYRTLPNIVFHVFSLHSLYFALRINSPGAPD